uniref:GAG-pre-integrase domain-containing protein n=1 Tax=Nicotiana tabacum TaxID=4097 RepID=A0A1S3Z3P6_TOBAC|nr:PREDICTED: uncharacterized protein LOC107782662 [Nicotiana tabacum]
MMNELKKLTKEVKDWKLKHEVCEIEKEVLQEEFEELQMQLNGMCKSTSHISVRSNQTTYRLTRKRPTRTKSTSINTNERPKNRSEVMCHSVTKVGINILFVVFVKQTFQDGFGNQKILNLVTLTLQDPGKLGYLKESNHLVSQEHHRMSRKGKWYLDSACSSHMTGDKNLFKEVTKIDGGSVKFGDDSKGKIIGTGTIPFNNNCDITEVYLVDGLNYNLLSISQLCDSGYEVNFKKTGCAIEDESDKIVLPGKRYGNVYILDSFEKIDGHICLSSMSDDPWLWHRKLGHASMHLIEKLSKHELVVGLPKLKFSRTHICDACQMESVQVIFDENNPLVEKGITAGDEDQAQETQEIRKSQESTDTSVATESTSEDSSNVPDQPIESTTNVVRPNEWRSEPEYPQKFIIGDPNEGMKIKGALKKKANIALISQIDPKKIEEALKDSSWVQAM